MSLRLVRFGGAMSLDGYIAGPNGEYDWIVMDPDLDLTAQWAQIDTFLIGRKTFEVMRRMGDATKSFPGIRLVVFSRTLRAEDCPGMTLSSDAEEFVAELRTRPGKDIAVFGGGELFRSLLGAGLVDRVEVSLVPVLLGGGIPLLPAPAARVKLELHGQRVYERTGTIALEYRVLSPNLPRDV